MSIQRYLQSLCNQQLNQFAMDPEVMDLIDDNGWRRRRMDGKSMFFLKERQEKIIYTFDDFTKDRMTHLVDKNGGTMVNPEDNPNLAWEEPDTGGGREELAAWDYRSIPPGFEFYLETIDPKLYEQKDHGADHAEAFENGIVEQNFL